MNPSIKNFLPFFILIILQTINSIESRGYYPPKMEEPPTTNRIKLNLGVHVPPIIVKMPRMEMPQLVIGANIIKNPKAKPLTINMPPPPSISFGDPAPPPPPAPPKYEYAAGSNLDMIKLPSEIGFDMKAYGSGDDNKMISAVPPPVPAAPVPMIPTQYPMAQYVPPPPQYQYPAAAAPKAQPPTQPQMMYPSPQQSPAAPQMMMMAAPPPPQMYPAQSVVPPMSIVPPPPQMMAAQYYYPQQPQAQSYPMESQPLIGMETQFHPQAYQHRKGMMQSQESSSMMYPHHHSHHHHQQPRSPFQLIKDDGNNKFQLKPNAEFGGLDNSEQSEIVYQASDLIGGDGSYASPSSGGGTSAEDYAKEYNAAPKILMHKYQRT